mgnify:FL=1
MFIVMLIIDAIALMYLFRQAFIQRSNMNRKYKRWFVLLACCMAAAWILHPTQVVLSWILAGVPAALLTIFVVGLAIALTSNKNGWR